MKEIKCKHMIGLLSNGNTKCRAGVDVRKLVGGKNAGWVRRIPCNKFNCSSVTCQKFQEKTKAEIEKEEDRWQKIFEQLEKVSPWATKIKSENSPASYGKDDCPVCGKIIRWTLSSYKGHMHACCETSGCVKFME